MYRSTKGASKARRDLINAEIRNLRDLLPVSDADKARLSYLHIMSLACMYTRKSVFFSQDMSVQARHEDRGGFLSLPELSELVHTLPGFLILLSSEGKLLYLSDNVSEHLGHSMVDLVAQSDSVYDIIDPADHFVMRSNLLPMTTPDSDVLFRCRFNTSKFVRRQGAGTKQMLVRARCLLPSYPASSYWTSNPVWVCFCSPLKFQGSHSAPARNPLPTPPADQTFFLACFQSWHNLDMTFQNAQESVNVYLGYEVGVLQSRSWYSLLHPRDLSHASAQHCTLLREGRERQVEMVVQVEAADHSWVWLYMVLQLETGEHPITCQNYVISESEAWSVRQQLFSEQNQLALLYQEGLGWQSSDTLSSPEQVFTPSSSGLSTQSFDFSFSKSGRSSSEELSTPATTQHIMPQSNESCPDYSSLDEESFTQQHTGHRLWEAETNQLAASSETKTVPNPLFGSRPEADLMCFQIPTHHSDPQPSALGPPAPLPSLVTPQPSQCVGELVCTPPYTPQLGDGTFMFGDELFKMEPTSTGTSASTPTAQTMTLPVSTSYSLSKAAQNIKRLVFPTDKSNRLLHERMPPTPDSPGNGDCTLMALPEIRGPLYVDVPHRSFFGPPEGLLTPEASPTKPPCSTFFSQETEQEKLEISLLAQYISSLAERFCPEPPLSKHDSSFPSIQDPIPPSCDFLHDDCWRGLDASVVPEDNSLIEECILADIPLQVDSSSSPSLPSPDSSSCSTSQFSHPATVNWCSPSHTQGEESTSVGVHHFCSVQSAHSNCMAVGGPLGAGLSDEGVALSENVRDVEMLPPSLSPTILASPQPSSVPAQLATASGLPCAQSLLEELVAMEPVFGAGASISPALRQEPELYQLPHDDPPQSFYQDGASDHMF
ncbi:neuronal PAS domain-containing protein 4B [Chanos chanos]|uniref:Neuronal PAS domain-containing protein 4B n=1 Tax=Chanos chanos TaxID=29144 RepID=A0A6J2W0W2_CHACN|nr:neuronal PAS domain-containing protein 4B-like [Chanos chanos]